MIPIQRVTGFPIWVALQAWSILGDAESGYILTEGDDNLNCLLRDEETVKVAPCDTGYATLSLQFASKEDIALMMSPGARQEDFGSTPLSPPILYHFPSKKNHDTKN